jgi:predicted dehydrogenase
MSAAPPLRVAVIGAGHLGRHHARILSQMEGVVLAAVVDVNATRAGEVAAATRSEPYTDFRDLVDRIDAVTVAVPTEAHAAVAVPFLQRGTPVLVEKPLARTLVEAENIVAAAASSGATLAVGHTERYNPAVAAALPLVISPRFIEVHRLGTFSERSLDVDVVFDLMIHDLDIVLSTVDSEVATIEAVGVPVLTPRVDIANVRLRFASGCIANLTASRISRERVRKARFFQPDAYVSVDYSAQEVEAFRLNRRDGHEPIIEGGRLDVSREEPLARELADFIRAARSGDQPYVTGEDGRRAVALAERITSEMERHAWQT